MKTNILKAMMKGTAGGSPPPASNAWDFPKLDPKNPYALLPGSSTYSDIFIGNSGNHLYLLINNYVHRMDLYSPYTLHPINTASDVSTKVHDTISVVSGSSFSFSSHGVWCCVGDISVDEYRIYSFQMSTAWVPSTKNFNAYKAIQDKPSCVKYNNNGTKIYVYSDETKYIYEYNINLASAWQVHTANKSEVAWLHPTTTSEKLYFHFSPDGTKMSSFGLSTKKVWLHTLSTAWHISTATLTSSYTDQYDVTCFGGYNSDGSAALLKTDTGIQYHSLAVNYALSTTCRNPAGKYHAGVQYNNLYHTWSGVSFNTDGTKVYFIGYSGPTVLNQLTCTTPWDIGTVDVGSRVTSSVYTTQATGTSVYSFIMCPTGYRYYLANSSTYTLYQYEMSTAWDISTTTYAGVSYAYYTSNIGIPYGAFNADGTKLFILRFVSSTSTIVYQHSLSTPWNIATATILGTTLSLPVGCRGLFFKSDGSCMYTFTDGSRSIQKYILSTPWDVSTASTTGVYTSAPPIIGTQHLSAPIPDDINVSYDGTKVYVSKYFNGSNGTGAVNRGIEQINVLP